MPTANDHSTTRLHYVLGAAAGVALLSFMMGAAWGAGHTGAERRTHVTPSIATIIGAAKGRQVLMIVLGSSTCGASQGTRLASAIQHVRDSLRTIALHRAIPFASIGVAVDADPERGIQWLKELGGFDEVTAGEAWLNSGAIDFVWREPRAVGATPQIIVAERTIQRDGVSRLRVLPPVVLVRMFGAHDIISMAGLNEVDSLLAQPQRT